MSIRVMTAVWAVNLPASEKLVLLALADCANDEGHCWPGLRSLSEKTGKCKRSLQESLRLLDKAGHITRTENPGKGMNYVVHPVAKSAPVAKTATRGKICTGGKTCHEPVAKSAPKPSRTVISSEAKASSPRAMFLAPQGVSDPVWSDFLNSPKRRKAGMSATAYAGICNNLHTLAEHGYPPGKMMALAVERGWTTVKLEWVQNDERRWKPNERSASPTVDAASRILRDLRANDPASQDPNAGRPNVHDDGAARSLVARRH